MKEQIIAVFAFMSALNNMKKITLENTVAAYIAKYIYTVRNAEKPSVACKTLCAKPARL